MGLRHLLHLNVGALQGKEEKRSVHLERGGSNEVLALCPSPYTAL